MKAAAPPRTLGDQCIAFIETFCRLTRGSRRGQLVKLLPFQKALILELFELAANGQLRYRRAYIQMPRKNGKTFLFACIALFMAYMGEDGGEVYFVAGDRQQAHRAFDEVRMIVEQDPTLLSRIRLFRQHMEIPSTGTILRVLSSEVGLQMGLSPSFVLFDEVAVQPNDKLWTTMTLGSAAREQPMVVGISTPGWEKDSLAFRLYQHGKKVRSGEVADPTFYFTCFEPSDPECDYTDPKVWRECNPALGPGGFLQEADFYSQIQGDEVTPEMEFRRFRLGQWTEVFAAAFPAGIWDGCARPQAVKRGSAIVLGFDGSRERDCTALMGCTLDLHLFKVGVWEANKLGQRIEPKEVIAAIKEAREAYDVRVLVADEHLWTWVLLQLEEELKVEVLAMPQNNVRYVAMWQRFSDAVAEHRLTHDGDPTVGRHVASLVLKSDRFGVRATRDRTSPRSFIDAAMASQFAVSQVVDLNTQPLEVETPFFYDVR